jgi:hypothetical protein
MQPEYGGYYGDLSQAYYSTLEEHDPKIEVFSHTYKQQKILYFKVPYKQSGAAIARDSYHGGRFFLVKEGRPPFVALKEKLLQL